MKGKQKKRRAKLDGGAKGVPGRKPSAYPIQRLTVQASDDELKLIKDASQPTMNEIEKILIYHFTALMHHPPKMAKHFLK